MSDMSIWALIQNYRDETGSSEAWVMRRAGLNKGTFSAWRKRGVPQLPDRASLLGLAEALKVDYETVVMAVLHDARYLPESAARAEQARIEAQLAEMDALYAKRVQKLVQDLLSDAEGRTEDALAILDDIANDGSIDPDLAHEAAALLNRLSEPPATTETSVAADDGESPIERGQGHDEHP